MNLRVQKTAAYPPVTTTKSQFVRTRNQRRNTNHVAAGNHHLMNVLADVLKTIMNQNGKVSSGQISLNNDNQHSNSREERSPSKSKESNEQLTLISNVDSIQKSKYGERYRQSLDPRDQMLTHPFQFILQIPSSKIKGENKKSSFMKTEAYQRLCADIQEYIVDVVENVISVSFNFLIEGKLKENESKDYASKNLLLNLRSLFREVMQTLTEDVIDRRQTKKLRYALCELIDNTLNQSLNNLAAYYPQAPPTGGTPRMRQTLLSIDRNHNQELDFLYTQNLKLKRQEDGNYTEFIMRVINRAVEVTGEIDPKDPFQRTLFEKFVAFSEKLFWVAQEDSYSKILHDLGDVISKEQIESKPQSPFTKRQYSMSPITPIHQKPHLQSIECQSANTSFQRRKNDESAKAVSETRQIRDVQSQKHKISGFMRRSIFAEYSEAKLIPETNREKTMEQMKKRHDFQIGQKIPSSVQPFSKKDIMDKHFSAKNSEVLRILTKWAQNLENIFDNPQTYTTNRVYPFKTLNHEIVYPKKQLKQLLYRQIVSGRLKKQKIRQYLITRNKVFQGSFLAKENPQDLSRFIKRYTDTRVLSSKMNALLIQFMKEYVSSLIHLLVQAGRASLTIEEGQYSIVKQYSINLITFNIGDLMRSKLHCSEASFIRLLKTLYILEETSGKDSKAPFFELVRIKNKLDSRDNNILINYLFMGKVQCELQMSVQKMTDKQLNYYSFSHFLYELTRGKFGILAECATIICQNDPIISSSPCHIYYEPKQMAGKKGHVKKHESASARLIRTTAQGRIKASDIPEEEKKSYKDLPQNEKEERSNYKTFVCRKCETLKLQENMNFLKRSLEQRQMCNRCLIDRVHVHNVILRQDCKAERLLKDERMAEWIMKNLEDQSIQKLVSYEDLRRRSSRCLVFTLCSKKNELQFSLFNSQQAQKIFYLSRITKDLWQADTLVDKKVQYQDITAKIKQAVNLPQYTYIVTIDSQKGSREVFKRLSFMKQEQVLQRLGDLDQACQAKILKDQIIGALRNKSQSLEFNSNCRKLAMLNQMVEEKTTRSKAKWIEESLSHIQFIFAESMAMEVLPSWLVMCQKIELLNLSENKIKDIAIIEGIVTIKELILKGNQIHQIDWRKLTNLQRLNVSHNHLKRFAMENLPASLLQIDLGDNQLERISLQSLPLFLRKVDVFGNELKGVLFKDLPLSLQYLDLSYNKLQNIEYYKLSSVKVLFLNSNALTSFKISDMPYLEQFSISGNRLKDFSIRKCRFLKQLHVGGTCLTKLDVIDFPALVVVSMHENPLLNWLQLKDLPRIRFINMHAMAPQNLAHFRIQRINLQTVFIKGNVGMTQFLSSKFPCLKFSKEEEEDNSCYSLDDSDEQSFSQGIKNDD